MRARSAKWAVAEASVAAGLHQSIDARAGLAVDLDNVADRRRCRLMRLPERFLHEAHDLGKAHAPLEKTRDRDLVGGIENDWGRAARLERSASEAQCWKPFLIRSFKVEAADAREIEPPRRRGQALRPRER